MMSLPILIHRPIIASPNHTFVKSRLKENELVLGGGLEKDELMPKHVAMISDGNRRWAKNRGLPLQHGYRVGAQVLKQLAINCSKYGVKVLSNFAFSTENWSRPQEEVDLLMNIFGESIASHMEELIEKENVQVSYIGDRRRLSESLQKQMGESEEHGKTNTGLHLVIALNYSGQYDLVEASRKIATKVKHGILREEDIDPSLLQHHLQTNVTCFPNPDLLIRTSGELRISNFMLWQLAYSEMYFLDKMFPDFDEVDLNQALTEFQRRRRRFGGN